MCLRIHQLTAFIHSLTAFPPLLANKVVSLIKIFVAGTVTNVEKKLDSLMCGDIGTL